MIATTTCSASLGGADGHVKGHECPYSAPGGCHALLLTAWRDLALNPRGSPISTAELSPLRHDQAGPGFPKERSKASGLDADGVVRLSVPECAGVCPSWAQVWAQLPFGRNSLMGNLLK